MAEQEQATVQIVYLARTPGVADDALEATHLDLLSSVLGSEAAAKDAMLYSYKTVANGFSAKLTPTQAAALSEKPGVLQVVPSQTLQLHGHQGATVARNT